MPLQGGNQRAPTTTPRGARRDWGGVMGRGGGGATRWAGAARMRFGPFPQRRPPPRPIPNPPQTPPPPPVWDKSRRGG